MTPFYVHTVLNTRMYCTYIHESTNVRRIVQIFSKKLHENDGASSIEIENVTYVQYHTVYIYVTRQPIRTKPLYVPIPLVPTDVSIISVQYLIPIISKGNLNHLPGNVYHKMVRSQTLSHLIYLGVVSYETPDDVSSPATK